MAAYHALLGFAGWTLLLVLLVFAYRGFKFLTGTPINSWPRGVKSDADVPFVTRVADAHANCLENLVIFAVIAAIVLFQLYNVLGKKVGRQPQEDARAQPALVGEPQPTQKPALDAQAPL